MRWIKPLTEQATRQGGCGPSLPPEDLTLVRSAARGTARALCLFVTLAGCGSAPNLPPFGIEFHFDHSGSPEPKAYQDNEPIMARGRAWKRDADTPPPVMTYVYGTAPAWRDTCEVWFEIPPSGLMYPTLLLGAFPSDRQPDVGIWAGRVASNRVVVTIESR